MDKQSLPPSFISEEAEPHLYRFKITYCHSCGFRQRAVKVAAELEEHLQENTIFVEGSNGIFEVEDKGVNIFSYKERGRFPETGEITGIVQAIESGTDVNQAKNSLPTRTLSTESFEDWFVKAYGKSKK
ncbi:MAG: Rdx family protein [Candidatus Obscuribacterales bacterium]|nr:Rdx family protein [Candidatus Obscuribacterales bacterium]